MRRLVLPLLLGGAVLLSPIASRSSAPEPTLREGLVLLSGATRTVDSSHELSPAAWATFFI